MFNRNLQTDDKRENIAILFDRAIFTRKKNVSYSNVVQTVFLFQ